MAGSNGSPAHVEHYPTSQAARSHYRDTTPKQSWQYFYRPGPSLLHLFLLYVCYCVRVQVPACSHRACLVEASVTYAGFPQWHTRQYSNSLVYVNFGNKPGLCWLYRVPQIYVQIQLFAYIHVKSDKINIMFLDENLSNYKTFKSIKLQCQVGLTGVNFCRL